MIMNTNRSMGNVTKLLLLGWLSFLHNLIMISWPNSVMGWIAALLGRMHGGFFSIQERVDRFFGWVESFYDGNRRLLALQCNLSLLGSFHCCWQSNLLKEHSSFLMKCIVVLGYLAYYIAVYLKSMRQNHNRPVRRRLNMTPAMWAALNWLLQHVLNYVAEQVQAQSDYADWYASGAFILFYIHSLSFYKLTGGAADFGAAYSAWTIAVAFLSHVIGGFFVIFMLPVISATYVIYQELKKLPPLDEDEHEYDDHVGRGRTGNGYDGSVGTGDDGHVGTGNEADGHVGTGRILLLEAPQKFRWIRKTR